MREFFSDSAAWLFAGTVIGSVASCVIVTIVWTKWIRFRVDGRVDHRFIVGHSLSTVSCFSFMVSYLVTILSIETKEGHGSNLTGAGFFLSLPAVLILPFSHTRIKWLSLLACSLNAVLLLSFAYFYRD